jgi:predicted ester cyclase
MESEVEAVARGAIQAINDRTLQSRAQELLDPSFVRHDLVQLFPDSHGPTGGSDFLGMILAAMPDFRLEIEDIICSEDRAMLLLRMTGIHTGQPLLDRPARGAKFSASAVFIYRVRVGRIIEAWQMFDGLAFFRLAGFLS